MECGPALDEYRESVANDAVATVMMLVIRIKLKKSVAVIRMFDIECHEHIFNGTRFCTLEYKQNELRRLVAKYKPKRVRIWEDQAIRQGFQDMDAEFRSKFGVESLRT